MVLLAAACLYPRAARAEQVVAVLAFGGDDEGNVRGAVIDPLFNRYTIIHGDKVLDACDALGIPMSRGRNLARCAKRAGAVAVVGGAVQSGKLSLVVFSGKDGQVLAKGAVPCRDRLSSRNLRKALALVLKGLRKAPKGAGGSPRPAPKPAPSNDFSFDPEPVDRAAEPSGGGGEDLDEDPLTGTGTPSFDPDGDDPAVVGGGDGDKEKASSGDRSRTSWPALEVAMGFGLWSRKFTPNDPADNKLVVGGKSEPIGNPEYKSGAAFLIRLMAKVRPLAFFMEGLATGPFIKLMFQSTAGLQSRAMAKDPTTGKSMEQLLGTGFWELDFEVGYDWDIQSKASGLGPHVIASLGYATMDFSIDWPVPATTIAETKGRLPNVKYGCLLIKAGAAGNFVNIMDDWITLGGHFFFDFRPVLNDVAEVTDPTLWYGPASVNGLNMALGIDGRLNVSESIKILLTLEYTYTRYWYTFTEAASRVKNNMRAAGGALDELHGFLVNVGYAY